MFLLSPVERDLVRDIFRIFLDDPTGFKLTADLYSRGLSLDEVRGYRSDMERLTARIDYADAPSPKHADTSVRPDQKPDGYQGRHAAPLDDFAWMAAR
ncbi:MAG TPA: hypothetical protein VHE33_10080 [Acidobacteriaceae bacterium]|nr:hypothetical protein [Acidobacteriaceae bacterium]